MDHSVAAAERDARRCSSPSGARHVDPAFLTQTEDQFDARLVPWLFWSYNGLVVSDSNQPLVAPNLNVSVLDTLHAPLPDLGERNADPPCVRHSRPRRSTSSFSTRRPDGRRASRGLETEVAVPTRAYPTGYSVIGDRSRRDVEAVRVDALVAQPAAGPAVRGARHVRELSAEAVDDPVRS